eukprot:2146948-Rhodomonas_salina.1
MMRSDDRDRDRDRDIDRDRAHGGGPYHRFCYRAARAWFGGGVELRLSMPKMPPETPQILVIFAQYFAVPWYFVARPKTSTVS